MTESVVEPRNSRSFWILLLLGLVCGGCAFWAMPRGPAVMVDSVTYLAAAQNLLDGQGLKKFDGTILTHYPPGYPAILAAAAGLAGDMPRGGRWLHALLVAVNSCLVGVLVYRASCRDVRPAALAVLLFVSCESIAEVHLAAWSEAPFITCSLLTVLFLSRGLAVDGRAWVFAAALCMATGTMIRYAGVALLPPTVVVLLVFGRGSWWSRLLRSAIATAVAMAPVCLWSLRNRLVAGNATNREIIFHPLGVSDLRRFAKTAWDLWLPGDPPLPIALLVPIKLVAALAVGLILTWVVWKRIRQARPAEGRSLESQIIEVWSLLFGAASLAVLCVVKALVDAASQFSDRLILPLTVFLVVGVVPLLWNALRNQRRVYGVAVLALAMFLLVSSSKRTAQMLLDSRENGLGYASRSWEHSEGVDFAARAHAAGTTVYTNGVDALWHLRRFNARWLPRQFDHVTTRRNANYAAELNDMSRAVERGEAVAVYFDEIRRDYLPDRRELDAAMPAITGRQLGDGLAYERNEKEVESQ